MIRTGHGKAGSRGCDVDLSSGGREEGAEDSLCCRGILPLLPSTAPCLQLTEWPGFLTGQGETSSEGTEFKGIRLAMAGLFILPWPPCPAAESLVLRQKPKENPAATSLCIPCSLLSFHSSFHCGASPHLSPFLKPMIPSLRFIFKPNSSLNHLLLLLDTSQQSLFIDLFGVKRDVNDALSFVV